MSEAITLVYAVYGEEAEARAAAEAMIGQGLAACANILAPCTSIYRWEGKVEVAEEHPVLFKTSSAQRAALIAALAAEHSYDVPAVVAWETSGAHGPFADWVKAETQS